MDQLSLPQKSQPVDQLLSENANQGSTQSSKLVLLDQLVEVDTQKLKHQTEMLPVNERVLQAQQVVIIVLVHLLVQLLEG